MDIENSKGQVSSVYEKGKAEKVVADFSTSLGREVLKAYQAMAKLDEERTALNADKIAILDRMVTKGLKRDGFKAGYKRWLQDQEKREQYDETFLFCCKAAGVEFTQDELDLGDGTKH